MKIALFLKVPNQMIQEQQVLNDFLGRRSKRFLSKYKNGWIGNKNVEIGFDGNDFIRNQSTVSVNFDYFKTPRFIRKPAKKKNNFIKRYL